MIAIVCACGLACGCSSILGEAERRDCEVWQDDQQIELMPFCNNVQFLMVHSRSDAAGEWDVQGMIGRVNTWTSRGLSYGAWQTIPEWFESSDGGTSGY
jgi:hypothetical protein